MKVGTLIFFCGKMGAGKSTRSKEIALERNAVLLSEDEWLESIYPDQISSLDDYIKYSSRLKHLVKKLVQSILVTGTDVVMDFPANTVSQRDWFREIYSEVNATHNLILIDVPDEVCLERIEKRRIAQPERAATDTVEMFVQVTRYFVAPTTEEGFKISRLTNDA